MVHARHLQLQCEDLLVHLDREMRLLDPPRFTTPNHLYVCEEKFDCLVKGVPADRQ